MTQTNSNTLTQADFDAHELFCKRMHDVLQEYAREIGDRAVYDAPYSFRLNCLRAGWSALWACPVAEFTSHVEGVRPLCIPWSFVLDRPVWRKIYEAELLRERNERQRLEESQAESRRALDLACLARLREQYPEEFEELRRQTAPADCKSQN